MNKLDHLPRKSRDLEYSQKVMMNTMLQMVDVVVDSNKVLTEMGEDNNTKLAAIERGMVELQAPPALSQKLTPRTLVLFNVMVQATNSTYYAPPKLSIAVSGSQSTSPSASPEATLSYAPIELDATGPQEPTRSVMKLAVVTGHSTEPAYNAPPKLSLAAVASHSTAPSSSPQPTMADAPPQTNATELQEPVQFTMGLGAIQTHLTEPRRARSANVHSPTQTVPTQPIPKQMGLSEISSYKFTPIPAKEDGIKVSRKPVTHIAS
jgi:hypothetical protein